MKKILNKEALLYGTALSILMTVHGTAYTQAEDNVIRLEEIVVTARKRAESLQDVPASVQAYAGAAVQKEGYVDIGAMAASIPNFAYGSPPGASDVLIMRGLGTVGSGPHFEPAVGQVYNGFFASRSRLGRTAFVDLAQIEILRGPQGAVIGKNTSLGVINITWNKPTENFEASFLGSYDFEDNEGFEVEAVISGPLTDKIRGRFAVNYKDKDGFVNNTETGRQSPESEDITTRVLFEVDISENLLAEVFWQHTNFDRQGKGRELSFCNNSAAVLAAFGDDCTANGTNVVRNFFNGEEIGEPFDLNADMAGLTLTWDLGDVTVTSLTGYQSSDISDTFSSDLSPGDLRTINNIENYEQFSQEIRVASDGSGRFNYIAGIFFLDNDIEFTQDADFRNAPPGFFLKPLRRHQSATIDTQNISVFGEVEYDLTNQFKIAAGIRYTDEKRDGTAAQTNFDIYTFDNEGAKCGGPAFLRCNDAAGEINETAVSWNVNAQWRPTDDTLFYATVATGFKSGGFNVLSGLSNTILDQVFTFKDEQSINYEIGGKHDLFENRFRFNWSIFRTEVTDLQVSSNDPTVIAQTVNNAGEARSQGVEIEAKWAVSYELNLGLSAAFLDAEYTSFIGSPCFGGQTAAEGCVAKTQDLTGATPTRAPDYQFTFDADYTVQVTEDYDLTFAGKWFFVDSQSLSVDNDPQGLQDSYHKINASLTYGPNDGKWYISLVARNLTDEITSTFIGGTTAVNGPRGGGGRYSFTEEGRTIAIKFKYNFN
ncbi:MAG: hypothetical protein COB49_06275 [Alphaproteobacteria bacterium]|nr:MAG: hypothetical protein COB49_06275 [Alphaproteobacteria bacterium]